MGTRLIEVEGAGSRFKNPWSATLEKSQKNPGDLGCCPNLELGG